MIKKWQRGLVFLCLGMVGASVSPPASASPATQKAALRAERAVKTVQPGPRTVAAKSPRPGGAANPANRARLVGAQGEASPIRLRLRPPVVVAVPPPPVREPVLIPVSIGEESAPVRPVKAVPSRAYAVDGSSFYQNGHLVRIQGLRNSAAGELGKQRLQQMLDSGSLSVAPVSDPMNSTLLAVVRVNGQDVVDLMNGTGAQ
ncbi:MAG: hypothetical protein JNJ44_11650 [Zoogloeaceae bacterium]|nr:hypothetical protein [Zoogloeaceae bacterium]